MESKESSSFRDPSGYVFYKNGKVYRKVNECYLDVFYKFNSSEFVKKLFKNNWLVKHEVVEESKNNATLLVDKIPFISYPYEWCFNQLKDAALLTLNIEKMALEYGFTLKDASCYNVQFVGCNPIFIDTLSFDLYEENTPWGAYGQFCRHFLAPLLLMAKVDENLNCLLKDYIDGIPLDLAAHILKNRGGLVAWEHIKLHSKSISKNNNKKVENVKISKQSVINIIDMLIRQVSSLKTKTSSTEWGEYYNNTNYTDEAFKNKIEIVRDYLDDIKLGKDDLLCDLGANDGTFSKLGLVNDAYVLAMDIDYNAVSKNYLYYKNTNEKMLPLLFDFNNPSPAIGFDLKERNSVIERVNAKCVMALALIHHVCISNNVSFESFFASIVNLGKYLIVEFVPKDDNKVMKLLETRKDIFANYDIDNFEMCANKFFKIIKKKQVLNSKRIIYLMEQKNGK